MAIRTVSVALADGGGNTSSKSNTGKKYVNGRWVSVVSTTTGKKSVNASTGSTTGTTTTTQSGSSTGSSGSSSSKAEYTEKAYDIVEGSLEVLKANMNIKCRGAVELSGLGPVFSSTYYVSGVKVSLSASSMKQTLTLHKDTIDEVMQNSKETRLKTVEPKTTKKTYTVVRGDSLWRIAQNQLGKGSRWQEIYNLNKSIVGKNYLIHPGQVLTLPS